MIQNDILSEINIVAIPISKAKERITNYIIRRFKLQSLNFIDRNLDNDLLLSGDESIYSRIAYSKISTLVVKSLDDICDVISNEDELFSLLWQISEKNIRFISINEKIDVLGSEAKLALMLLKKYRETVFRKKSESVRNGIQNAKEKGKPLGRPVKRDIEKINELRSKGFTIQKIAETLKLSVGSVHRSLARG